MLSGHLPAQGPGQGVQLREGGPGGGVPLLVALLRAPEELRVDVAVPAVAAGLHPQAVLLGDALGLLDVGGDLGPGDHYVALLLRYGIQFHGLQDGAPDGPDGGGPLGGVRHVAVQSPGPQGLPGGHVDGLVQLVPGGGVVHDDEQGLPVLHRQGLLHGPLHDLQQLLLQKLDGRGDIGQSQDLGHHVRTSLHRGEGHHQGGGEVGLGQELQGDAGEDAQGPLGADDQVLDIIAGGVFHHVGGKLHDGAVRQHRLHAPDEIPGETISNRLHAPGVGADVAADGGGLLPGVRGIKQPACRRRGLNVLEQSAGLGGDGLVLEVNGVDSVHPQHREHDASVLAGGAPGQPGPRPPQVTGMFS